MHRNVLMLILLAVATLLPGCQSLQNWAPTFVRPYRPDIQQGNIVTKEMVDQLRPGMTRDQVRFLFGTPMLKNLFQESRWDYVYYLRRGSNDEEQLRRLTILFKDGKVDSFNSDPMPSETMADNLILGRDPKFVPKAPEHYNKPPVNPTPTPGL